jgi:hypothetical protein
VKLVEFPEQTVVIAKDQPQYEPLPAHVYPADPEGRITCCWELSEEELAEVTRTKRIWHTVLTFGGPLQPQLLQVDKPEMPR